MSQPKSTGEPEFAAFIAIDWADREHAWAMEVAGSGLRERGKVEHTPEAIEAWAMGWASRFSGRPVAVALEQARGALVYALSKYQHVVLFPIHPSTSHDYRKAMFPSGTKDDPKDADLLLDLLTQHRDRLRARRPDTELTRKLQMLVEKRRQLVDERTAKTNCITDLLKTYYPQALRWFDKPAAPILAAFLQRWPTLQEVQKELPAVVRQFFYDHHSRSRSRIDERLTEIKQAKPAIDDRAVIDVYVLMVQALLPVVAALSDGIASLDQAIERAFPGHPDSFIFDSFPAAGAVMAPRLLAAFGSQRDHYSIVEQMLSYSGIAPVTSLSGKSQRWIHFRWACAKFLRQTFHEYAALTIQHCEWAREFYNQQRGKGKARHAAIRALAFKWIRILFRCWQSRTPYDESVYLKSRQAHQTARPTAQGQTPNRGNPVELTVKNIAGFKKFSGVRA